MRFVLCDVEENAGTPNNITTRWQTKQRALQPASECFIFRVRVGLWPISTSCTNYSWKNTVRWCCRRRRRWWSIIMVSNYKTHVSVFTCGGVSFCFQSYITNPVRQGFDLVRASRRTLLVQCSVLETRIISRITRSISIIFSSLITFKQRNWTFIICTTVIIHIIMAKKLIDARHRAIPLAVYFRGKLGLLNYLTSFVRSVSCTNRAHTHMKWNPT